MSPGAPGPFGDAGNDSRINPWPHCRRAEEVADCEWQRHVNRLPAGRRGRAGRRTDDGVPRPVGIRRHRPIEKGQNVTVAGEVRGSRY